MLCNRHQKAIAKIRLRRASTVPASMPAKLHMPPSLRKVCDRNQAAASAVSAESLQKLCQPAQIFTVEEVFWARLCCHSCSEMLRTEIGNQIAKVVLSDIQLLQTAAFGALK